MVTIMTVSLKELNGPDLIKETLTAHGITAEYLAKKLKQELNAIRPTRLKVKGAVSQETTKSGRPKKNAPRVICVSGVVHEGQEADDLIYGDGESVLEFNDADMALRQKARIDAHKLRGDYPYEKKDVNATGWSELVAEVMNEIDGETRGKLPCDDIY